ncbi:hypothetical protein B0H10DRAFT_1847393, partial [Mycena sp. CBHHK59/15]
IFQFLSTLKAPQFSNLQKHRQFISQATRYMIHDRKLLHRNRKRLPLVVIMDLKSQLSILTQAHKELGHCGSTTHRAHLKNSVFWPHMHNDTRCHVASCHQCKIQSTCHLEIPITVLTPVALFQKMYIDIMMMPESNQF